MFRQRNSTKTISILHFCIEEKNIFLHLHYTALFYALVCKTDKMWTETEQL